MVSFTLPRIYPEGKSPKTKLIHLRMANHWHLISSGSFTSGATNKHVVLPAEGVIPRLGLALRCSCRGHLPFALRHEARVLAPHLNAGLHKASGSWGGILAFLRAVFNSSQNIYRKKEYLEGACNELCLVRYNASFFRIGSDKQRRQSSL